MAFSYGISLFFSGIGEKKEVLSTLSFIGSILALVVFCMGLALLKIKPSPNLGILFFLSALLLLIIFSKNVLKSVSLELIFITVFFLFILGVRLLFIKDLLVPPNSDSVQHVLIVRDFIDPKQPSRAFYNISDGFSHYYHFGFHALAAWLSGITKIPPEKMIMLLGQYFQALAVLIIYPFSYAILRNSQSAWIVMLLSGLYLPYPAYASNWGKYPAISSIIGVVFVATVSMIVLRRSKYLKNQRVWWLVGIATISAIILHSRSLFLLISIPLILLTYKKIALRYASTNNQESEIIKLATVGLVVMLSIIYLLIDPLNNNIGRLLFFILITTISVYTRFAYTSTVLLFISILGVGAYLNLGFTFLPSRFSRIFDFPYIDIFLYIPICLIVWSGIDGTLSILNLQEIRSGKWPLGLVLSIGLVNVFFFQNHYPSNCCILLREDDLFAFKWMEINLPQTTKIGIASIGVPGNFRASDGGAWIEAMTGIPTQKIDADSEFNWLEKKTLCAQKVTHLYSSGQAGSFDEYKIILSGGSYVFGIGTVHLYHINCNKPP